MDLHIDGSGVTVVDRLTSRRVAVFELSKHVDGRTEARRYVGCRAVAEAGQEVLRAAARQDAAALAGAADLFKCALEAAGLRFDREDHEAAIAIQARANAKEAAVSATDTSTTTPQAASQKAGKRGKSKDDRPLS